MASPPLSSASSSTGSPALSVQTPEQLSKTEPSDPMAFDSQETLELLLQTITQNMESSNGENNSDDWSQMSAWTTTDPKAAELAQNFDFSFPMDLDFDPTMAVDPSALHFNTSMFTQPMSSENPYVPSSMDDLMAASIFANQAWPQANNIEPGTGRRLSITSSSSSSGASLSPILEPQSAVSSSSSSASSDYGDYSLNESDPAYELAQRVRQSAGVTLAVPVSAQVQQLAAASIHNQNKVAIPRLARPSSPPVVKRASPPIDFISGGSPVASSPSDSTSSSASASPKPEPSVVIGVSGRPKTSHTTIERRYRTNLNARITGLKQAVPALRVLELKNGAPSPYNDVVDSRGFVDGVKVARKMSKANVLGKATEYIRVLKKREARLKREQDGLRSLVSGLVGGPALLREWEREWKDKFGGDETDEIELGDAAGGSDDEDGDGDDSDGEEGEEGRARKKAKVVKAPKKEKVVKPAPPPPAPLAPGAVPEKRKRGRPRKIPLPPVVSAPITLQPIEGAMPAYQPMQPQSQEPGAAPATAQPTQQYLLAAFAFFSVFNSPLASSFGRSHRNPDQNHSHHGVVLNAHPSMVPTASATTVSSGYSTNELVQAFHLLVSTLVFFYIVFPWLTGALRRNRLASGVLQKFRSSFSWNHNNAAEPAAVAFVPSKAQSYQRALLMDALSPVARGSPDEATRLRQALGVTTGVLGLMQSVIKAARIDRGLEMNQLEQRAWVRLGELIAFNESVSRATRLQTYWCMAWHVSTFATSTSDLTTLALIILPISRSKATELWTRAEKQEVLRPYERIVLSNMSVEDAAEWLAKWQRFHDHERKGRCAACEKRTPLGILAAILTRERLRKHAAAMFVRTVIPSRVEDDGYGYEADDAPAEYDAEQEDRDDQDRLETIRAGKAIGGRTAELAVLLERIWDTGFCSPEDFASRLGRNEVAPEDFGCVDEHDLARNDEAEIRTLLNATQIYRRIFPSTFPSCATAVSVILSPPPSPSRKNLAMHVSLRAALASSAFDFDAELLKDERLGAVLEDARDRVNDMLTALERSVRRNARA
ncbi:hypothetical protein BDW22DRAFT_1358860 [Trametopsis cervina]|nr:hypothetical protein BDW22DRAFT_1358860 [Trametopsis cervina]